MTEIVEKRDCCKTIERRRKAGANTDIGKPLCPPNYTESI